MRILRQVWNISKETDSFKVHPQWSARVGDVQNQLYSFQRPRSGFGRYAIRRLSCHPYLKGKWPIKAVLSVVTPELSYEEMSASNATKAISAWIGMVFCIRVGKIEFRKGL